MLDDDLMMMLLLHFPPSHPCASGRKKHTPGISQNLSFMKSSPTRIAAAVAAGSSAAAAAGSSAAPAENKASPVATSSRWLMASRVRKPSFLLENLP